MITNLDLNINNKSYIKKDFYQIYPEIVDLVKELTEYWDPENTNESDPGVVLLKIAAFVADKLNYNIDKNILEAFITSATQEEAVRKICELMGYNMKYYNSATTEISFMWTGEELSESTTISDSDDSIILPWFDTKITNEAGDIIYTLINNVTLNKRYVVNNSATAIQGDVVDLEINDDNVLTVDNLDNKNRFYLPELAIAENGIWIFNKGNITEDGAWKRIENLNTEILGKNVWKFGYDSKRNTPYIQFPNDIVSLIGDGLVIKYTRTAGKSGNIKANTLTKLQDETLYTVNNPETPITDVGAKLLIKNLNATTNGTDIETIDQAYESYKKTIGIFDTLVTCRDYAAAIYKMVFDEKLNNNPIVSNCQVSDVRSDINFANNVVKYGNLGTYYEDVADSVPEEETVYDSHGTEITDRIYYVKKPKINDYDLILYPLNPIYNSYNEDTFVNSFTPLYDNTNSISTIKRQLADYKTISHKIKQVSDVDASGNNVYLYKNYYRLNAKIITQNKVNTFEQEEIRQNIFKALYENFNPRHLEYGEEIPYELLLKVIQEADARIKLVNLDEPTIQSYYMTDDGQDHILYDPNSETSTGYMSMVAKNVLAGRVPLFDYNKSINVNFDCTNVSIGKVGDYDYDRSYGAVNTYYTDPITSEHPTPDDLKDCSITYATTWIDLSNLLGENVNYTLKENEMVQLITPRLVSDYIYPMYTNYYYQSQNSGSDTFIEADLPYKLKEGEFLYINYTDGDDNKEYWIKYTWNWVYTMVNGVIVNDEDFNGIIKSNFNLYDSGYLVNSGKYPAKTKAKSKTQWPEQTYWPIDSMFSLQTTEQIDIMSYAKSRLTSNISYLYWISNNNNTLTFKLNKVDKTNGYALYQYILEDGEYLFYTDNAKTNLVSIGSGNSLILRQKVADVENPPGSVLWTYNTASTIITADSVMEKGIGVFSDIDWVVKRFSDNEYLQVDQMEIRSISSGKLINSLEITKATEQENFDSSQWHKLVKITYDGSEVIKTTDAQQWAIRPFLNLNIGPNKVQMVEQNHAISFYTSQYYLLDKPEQIITNDQIYDYLKYNPTKIGETILSKVPVITITNNRAESGEESGELSSALALKSNLNVQRTGGYLFSVHTSGINASKYDNLSIYTVDTENSSIKAIGKDGTESVLNTNNVNFTQYTSATFPIYVPNNNYNIISIYYSANSNETFELELNGGTYIEYEKLFDSNVVESTNEYGAGLHHFIIRRTAGDKCTLTLSSSYTGTKALVIANKLVIDNDKYKGLNYKLFNFTNKNENNTNDYQTLFENYVVKQKNFFATLDIENNMLLDFDDLSNPYCLFNYNNIINHFVLSELDVKSFDNIQIATSSKIGK